MTVELIKTGAAATGENWRDNWQTPPEILDRVNEFWPSGWLDPCPPDPTFDGLKKKWAQQAFINPPFSQYLKWLLHGLTQKPEQIWIGHHSHDTQAGRLLLNASRAAIL